MTRREDLQLKIQQLLEDIFDMNEVTKLPPEELAGLWQQLSKVRRIYRSKHDVSGS